MRRVGHSIILMILLLAAAVSANYFHVRAESSAAASGSAAKTPSPTASDVSASASGTAPPAAASTGGNATAAVSNSTANDTASATSSSSEAAKSATPTATCHIDVAASGKPEKEISPICQPTEGQLLLVGKTYSITWDPTLFDENSINYFHLQHVNNTNGTDIWSEKNIPNSQGHVDITINPDFLNGYTNNTELKLFIDSQPPGDAAEDTTSPGRMIRVITNNTNSTSSGHGKGDKDLGEKAGIPVGLGIFLIACAGLLFWFLRRRRSGRKGGGAGYMAKRRSTARMTGDDAGVGAGFRDEPTRGMELQDRGGRQDSWEAGWDNSSNSNSGGGNAFRDEIERQRTGGRR